MRIWPRRGNDEPEPGDLVDAGALRAVVDGVVRDAPLRELLTTIAEAAADQLGPCRLSFHGPRVDGREVGAGTLSIKGVRATVSTTITSGPLTLSFTVWLPPVSADADRGRRIVARACELAQVALVAEEARSSRRARLDTDPLTGILNRSGMLTHVTGAIAAGWVGPFAVIGLDLDGLKRVSDRYGLAAGGDRVLREAVARVCRSLGPTEMVARMGGDEFAVVCVGLPHPDAAVARAEAIRDALAEPHPFERDDVVCTATVGVALSDDVGELRALLDRAFDAVDVGKALGGNRVERWRGRPDWFVQGGYEPPPVSSSTVLTSIGDAGRLDAFLTDAAAGGWPDGGQHAVLALDLDDVGRIAAQAGFDDARRQKLFEQAVGRLCHAIRPIDVAARTGDDEFVVAGLGFAVPEDVDSMAEHIRQELARISIGQGLEPLTATIGVAVTEDHTEMPVLVERARAAARAAKAAGRNRVVRSESTMPE